MKAKLLVCWLVFFLFASATAPAGTVVSPWIPIYKGVDRAVGTNFPDATNPRLQVVNCVRVDLSDPDVQLFPTPRYTNYLADTRETMALSVSNFVKVYGVQVAINANFYWSFCCGASNPSEGAPATAYGLLMSTGSVVSVPDGAPPGDSNPRAATILFTTNKEPILAFRNIAPGMSTTGIFSAVTGYFFVLSNGVNVGDATITAYPDGSFHNEQPRTAIGVSADRRYLFMMTIDGRQPGYSVGAVGRETADWLSTFGASDGVTMDGGGSTSMYMADCAGNPVALNKSSYVVQSNRERVVGAHLGIYAKPLDSFVSDVVAQPASQTAVITWNTASNATSQVEYGLTPSYGTLTPLDSALTTNHSVVLSGLQPQRRYYFRVLSISEGVQYQSTCAGSSFVTTNFAGGVLMPLTQTWRYRTGSLDGVNWTAPTYDDSAWPSGPGALWADNRSLSIIPNTNTIPNFLTGTRMPVNQPTNYPYPTYYFRSTFNYSNSLEGLTLTFSNYLDDGAIFYLNGFELFRTTNMPAGPVNSGTYTLSGAACGGNATCPLVFGFTGNALSNVVVGTNVVAVEVHNFRSLSGAMLPSPDIVFESALLYTLPPPVIPPPFITNVVVLPDETSATLTWTTLSNATSRILYGTNGALGSSTSLETNLVSSHAVVVTNLRPRQEYFFQIVSTSGTNVHRFDGSFSTIPFHRPLVTFSNVWRYTTNSLDGVNWTDIAYDDAGWLGEGPALLYIENNPDVFPRNTALPGDGDGRPFPAYYFRAHFPFEGDASGFALLFTNTIDDGAVFYLNGVEIQRVRMPAGAGSSYETSAAACPPNGCDATFESPDVFRIAGDWMTNLVSGDNVLAVAVHQFGAGSSDVVFGSAVSLVRATASETALRISREGESICLSWDGEFLTLQRASGLDPSTWIDLPGADQTSPHCITNATGSAFYRLRD